MTPLPSYRGAYGVGVIGGTIYLVGGYGTWSYTAEVITYAP